MKNTRYDFVTCCRDCPFRAFKLYFADFCTDTGNDIKDEDKVASDCPLRHREINVSLKEVSSDS